jgi:hypothetical protein
VTVVAHNVQVAQLEEQLSLAKERAHQAESHVRELEGIVRDLQEQLGMRQMAARS